MRFTRSVRGAGEPALRALRQVAYDLHCLVAPGRRSVMEALPDALVIGAQRCGTTSLYHGLAQHPGVARAKKKEVHYFDLNYHRGLAWYQKQFERRRAKLNFEASPYYIFHPKAPERVAAALPDVKIIVILRDPVARAYSHYWHERRLGHETLSFADAIEAEAERLAGESTKLLEDDGYYSFNHQHFSYVARGCYAGQLMQWLEYIPRPRFLFVESESFFEDPRREMARITEFLALCPLKQAAPIARRNQGTYAEDIPVRLRAHLQARFARANRELEALTGMRWRWNA